MLAFVYGDLLSMFLYTFFFYFACITTLCFTETLIMHDFTHSQEFDRIAHIWILHKPENIIVSGTRFLFRCHIFVEICDRVAFGLKIGCGPGCSAGCLGPKCKRMVNIVFVKSGFFQFFRRQIPCQLVNDCTDDFHMRQFFRTYIVLRNVPNDDCFERKYSGYSCCWYGSFAPAVLLVQAIEEWTESLKKELAAI